MKSLWAQYCEEMNGATFIEHDWGFISYEEGIDCLALKNIFIIPEERHGLQGLNQLVNEAAVIAKEKGKPYMTGQIIMNAQDSRPATKSLKLHLGIGFEPYAVGVDGEGRQLLFLRKEVK